MKHLVALAGLALVFLTGCESPAVMKINTVVSPPEVTPTTCFLVKDQAGPSVEGDDILKKSLEEKLRSAGWKPVSERTQARVLIGYRYETTIHSYSTENWSGGIYEGPPLPMYKGDYQQIYPIYVPSPDFNDNVSSGSVYDSTDLRIFIRAQDISTTESRELWQTSIRIKHEVGNADYLIPSILGLSSVQLGQSTNGVVCQELQLQ